MRAIKAGFFVFVLASTLALLGWRAYEGYVVRPGEREAVRSRTAESEARRFAPEAVDEKAKDFSLERLGGGRRSLSELAGRYVVVNFFATWCPPCVDELPSLYMLGRRLAARGVSLLAISADGEWRPVRELWGRTFGPMKPSFEVLLDPGGSVGRDWGTTKFPETYVVGPDGRVRARFVGPRDWDSPAADAYFDRLPGATAPPPPAERRPPHG